MKLILILLLFTVNAYATFTPFPPSPVAPDSLVTKGGLLTSDGRDQVEALACANDQIIVFDSAEANGFKCEAKPSGSVGASISYSSDFLGNSGTTQFSYVNVITVPSVVIGSSTNLEVDIVPTLAHNFLNIRGDGACSRRLLVDGNVLWEWVEQGVELRLYSNLPMGVTYPAGTYTIELQSKQGSGSGTCSLQGRLRIKTW